MKFFIGHLVLFIVILGTFLLLLPKKENPGVYIALVVLTTAQFVFGVIWIVRTIISAWSWSNCDLSGQATETTEDPLEIVII